MGASGARPAPHRVSPDNETPVPRRRRWRRDASGVRRQRFPAAAVDAFGPEGEGIAGFAGAACGTLRVNRVLLPSLSLRSGSAAAAEPVSQQLVLEGGCLTHPRFLSPSVELKATNNPLSVGLRRGSVSYPSPGAAGAAGGSVRAQQGQSFPSCCWDSSSSSSRRW